MILDIGHAFFLLILYFLCYFDFVPFLLCFVPVLDIGHSSFSFLVPGETCYFDPVGSFSEWACCLGRFGQDTYWRDLNNGFERQFHHRAGPSWRSAWSILRVGHLFHYNHIVRPLLLLLPYGLCHMQPPPVFLGFFVALPLLVGGHPKYRFFVPKMFHMLVNLIFNASRAQFHQNRTWSSVVFLSDSTNSKCCQDFAFLDSDTYVYE